MVKKLFLISLMVMAISVSAFAGEGSDTIGACKLLPTLRYAYYDTEMNVTSAPPSVGVVLDYGDNWTQREHNVTLQVDYGVTDYFDIYTFVGGRLAVDKAGRVWMTRGTGPADLIDFTFDIGSGFMCGGGVKATFYRAPNGFYFGGGASFTYAVTDKNVSLKQNDSTVAGLSWRETDIAATADLHAGWHIGDTGLTPYVGVEYRWEREYLDAEKVGTATENDYEMESKNPVGVVVGFDYMINNRLYFNLEGQMIKRWGGSFSVGYLFDLCAVPVVPAVIPETPVPAPQLVPMSMK